MAKSGAAARPMGGLTIRALRATPVLVPLGRPLGTSAMTVTHAPLLLVELQTDQGIAGHAYLFCYLRGAAPAMAAMVREVEAVVRGEPVVPLALARKLARHFTLIGQQGIARMAAAGLDVAAWDALARAAGLPLAAMLGGTPHLLPAYDSRGLGLGLSADAAADEAETMLEEGGFRAVKLRLGRPDAAADLAVLRAVRRRLPEEVAVFVDFNQALTVREAVARAPGLDAEGAAWVEEPVRHDDHPGCAAVARALRAPLQLGENFSYPPDMARALAVGACDLVMPDLERIGGVSGWMGAAGLAAAHGVEMSSHLFPEVSSHLLCATPTAHWLEYVDWAAPLLREPLRVRDGMVAAPCRPGNGLDWDPAALRRYAME
jgi:mandelate racemase